VRGSGFGVRGLRLGARGSGLGAWVSGFGFRVSGFGFRVWLRVAGLGVRVTGFQFRDKGAGFRDCGFGIRVLGVWFRNWGDTSLDARRPVSIAACMQGFGVCSGKCSQERLTRGTVTSTMRRAAHPAGSARCGAGAGCSAIKYQSLGFCSWFDLGFGLCLGWLGLTIIIIINFLFITLTCNVKPGMFGLVGLDLHAGVASGLRRFAREEQPPT